MGLILCMAADSASYLTIPELSVRVFSSEELCYCILKYPLLFLEDFLDDGVFRFLGTVTGDVRFKAELRDMKENGVKDEEIILRILEGATVPPPRRASSAAGSRNTGDFPGRNSF